MDKKSQNEKVTEYFEKNRDKYQKKFNEKGFWAKIKKIIKKVGCEALEKILILYYVYDDPDTPARVKVFIASALGYLLSPIDFIPDFIPVVGLSDDILVITYTLKKLVDSIKDEHKKKAKEKVEKICK